MKKIIFITVILSLLLVSCNLISVNNNKEEISIDAPDVVTTTSGIILTPKQVTGTLYYNVFRYEVTDSTNSATKIDDTLVNIGQIVPFTDEAGKTYSGAVSFSDKFSDNTKYYQYYIRYKKEHTYEYSKITNTYAGFQAGGEKDITNNTAASKIKLSLDDSQYILSFASTDITLPNSGDPTTPFSLMVAVNNGVSTFLFPMTEDNANHKYTLSLKNILPSDFIDTPLKIEMLSGKVKYSKTAGEYSTVIQYYLYMWTKPIDAEVYINTDVVDSFTVPSILNDSSISDFTPSANIVTSYTRANLQTDLDYTNIVR